MHLIATCSNTIRCHASYITHDPSLVKTVLVYVEILLHLLTGDERNDNLLHFATRYKLDGMAETLAHHIPKNKDVLWQVSSEKETATEIAKKNGMVQVMNTLERLQVSPYTCLHDIFHCFVYYVLGKLWYTK